MVYFFSINSLVIYTSYTATFLFYSAFKDQYSEITLFPIISSIYSASKVWRIPLRSSSSPGVSHTRCMNVCQIQLQPPLQTSYEITEKIKRTRAKQRLPGTSRSSDYPPSADWPMAITISPSFSTLQFGKSFREFEATFFRFLSFSSSSCRSLAANLMALRVQLVSRIL